MPKLWFALGQTSVILRVFIPDTSQLGRAGRTGLTFSSAGLIISTIADDEATVTAYTQAGSTIETITTLGTFAAPTATKCRFKEVDATNAPGWYEIQIADARWVVSNARSLLVTLPPVSGLNTGYGFAEVQLTSVNPQDAVAFGLSRIDALISSRMATFALPTNFSSLSIDGSGLVNIVQAAADKVWSTTTRALTDKVGFALSAAGVQAIWDALTSALTTVGSIGKLLVTNLDAAISSRTKPADTQARVTLVDTTTTLTNAPSDSAGVMTLLSRLSALRAGYLDNLSAGAVATAAALTSLQTDVTTALARLGTFTGTGVNTVLGFLRAMMRSDLSAPSDVGGTYDPTADSLQAIASGTTPSGIAASVWNYLVATAGTDITKMGGYIAVFLAAIRAKTDTIGTSTLTAVSPVTASGNLALVQGDSYLATDGRSFDFTYTGQPSFSGATSVLLRFTPLGSNSSIALDSVPTYYLTGSVLSATEVRFQMTSAQSAYLPANLNGGQAARFEVQITLSDASVITPTPLNQGKVSVAPQAAP